MQFLLKKKKAPNAKNLPLKRKEIVFRQFMTKKEKYSFLHIDM